MVTVSKAKKLGMEVYLVSVNGSVVSSFMSRELANTKALTLDAKAVLA